MKLRGAAMLVGRECLRAVGPWVIPELWSLRVANKVLLYARRHGRGGAVAFWGATLLGVCRRSVRGVAHRATVRDYYACAHSLCGVSRP